MKGRGLLLASWLLVPCHPSDALGSSQGVTGKRGPRFRWVGLSYSSYWWLLLWQTLRSWLSQVGRVLQEQGALGSCACPLSDMDLSLAWLWPSAPTSSSPASNTPTATWGQGLSFPLAVFLGGMGSSVQPLACGNAHPFHVPVLGAPCPAVMARAVPGSPEAGGHCSLVQVCPQTHGAPCPHLPRTLTMLRICSHLRMDLAVSAAKWASNQWVR